MLFCKVSFVHVCLYVFYAVIYFRVWLCGCGRENVRIFPGSAPGLHVQEASSVQKYILSCGRGRKKRNER